jgi:histone H3/H4
MLTKKQIKAIQDLIEKRFLAFSYEALGKEALSEEQLRILKDAGLIRESVRSMIADPYTMGKLVAMLPRATAVGLTYKDIERLAKKMASPTTDIEKKAIQYAKEHAGQYISGIGEDLSKEVTTSVSRASVDALKKVREGVIDSISNRKTRSELATSLFHAVDNKAKDWQRVAFTEMNNAIQQGIYSEIVEKSPDGHNQLVFKRPNPDACKHCKKAYLESDGVTPKIFKLGDLETTNYGKKANDWKPVIESVHPWCQCQLHIIPDNYGFVKKRIAMEEFSSRGKQYKRGQIISDEEFNSMSSGNKTKVGVDAVLSYTGEQAVPITKSELSRAISDNGDCDDYCSY